MSNPRVRKLKVYYAHRQKHYGKYPVIRLGGNYLHICGFKIGDLLQVVIEQDRVSITKCKAH